MNLLTKTLLAWPIFWGIDFIWLGLIAKNFYDKHLGAFNRGLNWPAVILVYLLIPLGIVLFVLPKADGDAKMALIWGAIYGLIGYGIYDLTNLATLKDWSITMVVADMLWGMFICGVTSYIVARLV